MKINDKVYGDVEISEPVLEALIASPSLQRLKHIDQAGFQEPHFPGSAHSRYEHSVGVCNLLRQYGAPLEEQIAGLIHDVSHSAFSHCADYVLAEGSQKEQSHQDNIFDDYVMNSEIPAILLKYGYDIKRILDDSNFPLKEKKLPDLCADRIDYSLRSTVAFKETPDVSYFLKNLTAENGQWIFKDFESALAYAKHFLKLNTLYYSGPATAAMFQSISDYLRRALQEGYITKQDLYTTDQQVLAKIAPHHPTDPQLLLFWERMNNRIPYKNDPTDYDGEVFCKSRSVDPLCRHEGKIQRVSDIDPTWKQTCQADSKPKQYFVKFER